MSLSKYNNPQVALHWLTAATISFLLVTGTFILSHIDNTDPTKINNLKIHMIVGGLALVLTLARIFWRARSPQPEVLDNSGSLMAKAGTAAHYVLNMMALVIAISGVGLALLSGLPEVVFFGQGVLPESFFDYIPRYVHGISTKIMLGLVALHILAAFYHAVVIKDSPFRRMWFGRQNA
ncbi:cytochrome b [Sedimenticola selenatireducens]|uniref:Cytochrome b n=1 Tax=Sedimenticola selenatireducens TaxID=191960 RepID=A0A557S0L9_9GAMM|nr:cytochrome b/b6 domain-containing protein [Sedimenticola selenatireducens]TVO70939.1 cytochrome b [Sedimenticola selenatireducens]TVT65805.1 MAG: cytochrome b [Sedimenticola selenatireducens]